MKTALALLALALILCFSAYAATDARSGVWTAEINADGTALQMTLFHGRDREARGRGVHTGMNNMMGVELSLASLTGLSAADARGTAANVQFALSRPAGSISFEGRFSTGNGAGSFRFTPSDAFVREMATLGYTGFKDEELLTFMTSDFTPQVIRDLRGLGYQPTQRETMEIAIFDINAAAVREFARLGYPKLSLRDLVNFRVGHVNAAYISGMRDAGYANLPANKLANLAIIGVTPEYIRDLRAAGLGTLSAQDAEELRIGNITPEKIAAFKRLGYTLTPRDLGEFGIQGVTPKMIEELRALGYNDLTAHQLTEMKIFGVTPEYIRQVEAKGYRGVPVEKLIKLRMAKADELVTGKK
jgi:hypothetical protein